MIVVDSSVWVDYFNGRRTPETDHLDALPGSDAVATGDLILAEVLQGFRDDPGFEAARRAMSELTCFDVLGCDRAERAARRYRELRRAGITIRKTADPIIGSFCIDAGFPLLFSDRDFLPMVDRLGLASAHPFH